MFATRAAVEEGILPGGGVALLRAAKALDKVETSSDDEKTGVDIIRRSCEAPVKQIAQNSGVDGAVVLNRVKDSNDVNFGFDSERYEYGDMLKFGILDTTKVVRCALENASSVAALLLTTECLVTEIPEKEKAPPMPPGGGGMGDMY